MPRTTNRSPAFLAVAETFYGPAFGQRKQKDLARSMAEWAEMDEDEQSFALAHLAYLDLQAQAGTQRLLAQVRDLLGELVDTLHAATEPEEEVDDVADEELTFELPDDSVPDGYRVAEDAAALDEAPVEEEAEAPSEPADDEGGEE